MKTSLKYPVVKLEEKHLQSTAELEKSCFPCPWNEEQFRHAMEDQFTELYGICSEEDNVIAYLLCSVVGDYAEILNIAADEKFRRQGLAETLLTYWTELEHIRNRQIILEVRAKNLPAQKLYEKFGFKQIHIRKNYYQDDDALVMERN